MKTIFLLIVTCCCAYGQGAVTTATPVAPTTSEVDPTGPDVFGVFFGRTPCRALAKEMDIAVSDECIKRKWTLVLYQDPKTHAPTTYQLLGSGYRPVPRVGKWGIVHTARSDSNDVIYRLDPDAPKPFLSFLKADDNVLLFVGKDENPLVGNIYFSYALYRTTKK